MRTTKTRKSVPLEQADSEGLERLRLDIVWQEAARDLGGIELSEHPSEAEALHAMLVVGRRVLAERVNDLAMERGYAALAATRTADDRELVHSPGRRTARRHLDD
jgi:hypothetical protein